MSFEVDAKTLRFKTVLPFTQKGIDLEVFIRDYEKDLLNSRVFYVLSPNQEDVFKVGIAGDSDGKAKGRFEQYRLYYGSATHRNSCLGVKVHFACSTKFNKMVEPKNSYIFKLELCMKRALNKRPFLKRGREWLSASLVKIQSTFNRCSGAIKEVETIPRRSSRLERKADNVYEIEKLVGIQNKGRQKVVEVKWKGYKDTTFEPYKVIKMDDPVSLANLERQLETKFL